MKVRHIERISLGCLFLGVFITNGAIYVLNDPHNHPHSGVVSMASWILIWLFLADSSPTKLSEGTKFRGAFTMGVAACYLLYHAAIGPLIPQDLLPLILIFTIWFFAGAVNMGLWWAEVSPPE